MSFLLPLLSGVASLVKAIRNSGDADAAANESHIRLTDGQPGSASGAGTGAAVASFAQQFRARVAKATDSNGDGVISRDELAQQLARGGVSAATADKQYMAMDKNGDGKVSVEELKDATPVPASPLVQHVLQMIEARRAAASGTAGGAPSS